MQVDVGPVGSPALRDQGLHPAAVGRSLPESPAIAIGRTAFGRAVLSRVAGGRVRVARAAVRGAAVCLAVFGRAVGGSVRGSVRVARDRVGHAAGVFARMNFRVRRQAFVEASLKSSALRLKKPCGAPGYTTGSMADPGRDQGVLEGGDDVGGDPLVRAAEDAKDRCTHLGGHVGRGGRIRSRLGRPTVEPDGSGQPDVEGRSEEREPTAEAEADGEQGDDPPSLANGPRAGLDVGQEPLVARLADMLHVAEVVASVAGAGRSTEVVDRDGVHTGLGEAQGELLVVRVQPADIGQDDDSGTARCRRPGAERGEGVAVVPP